MRNAVVLLAQSGSRDFRDVGRVNTREKFEILSGKIFDVLLSETFSLES